MSRRKREPMFDVGTKLADPALPSRIRSLGFRDHDVADVLAAAATVAARKDDLDAIAVMAEQLVSRIGNLQRIDGSLFYVFGRIKIRFSRAKAHHILPIGLHLFRLGIDR